MRESKFIILSIPKPSMQCMQRSDCEPQEQADPTRYGRCPPFPRDSRRTVYCGKTKLRRSLPYGEQGPTEGGNEPPPANSEIVSAVDLRRAPCGLLR